MHGLLRCNIKTGVHAHVQSGRVTQRCHNSPEGKRGLVSVNDVTHRKRAEDFGRFWKSQWVETRHRTRRLTFACSRRPLWRVPHVLVEGGRWKSQNRKIVPLSLCRRTFKLKGNKKGSYLNWEVVRCFSNFEIPMFYVIYVMNVPCTFRIFMYMAIVQFI